MSESVELAAEQAVATGMPDATPMRESDATVSSAAFVRDDSSLPSAARKLIPSFWRLVLGMALGLGVGVAVIFIVNPHVASDVHDAQRAAVQPSYVLPALACAAVAIVTGQAVMQVLMPLSPLPGGAGVAEFSYLALIGPSTPESMHVSGLILWRFFTWVIPVAVGAVSLGTRGAQRVT